MDIENKYEEQVKDSEKKDRLVFQPCLVVLSGVPLSGKTTLAERLVSSSNLKMLDVDVIRNEIDETRRNDPQIKLLEQNKEHEVVAKAYLEMCRQAESLVQRGIPVVVAGTFSKDQFKKPLEELFNYCNQHAIPFRAFLLTVHDDEASKRIEKRKTGGSLSPIDSLDKYQWAKGFFQKIEFADVKEVDSMQLDHFDQVVSHLQDLKIK